MRAAPAVVVALSLIFVGVGSGAPTSGTARPTLKLVRETPIQVKATGFRSRERVRVRVIAPKAASKWISATSGGRFTLSFPAVSIDRCSGLTIVAVGARGSHASLKRPAPYCPPQL